ncbi:hypothetical protein [Hyphococcus sp.]|uniref:hypothetical protein n=1 Tax=Hyphococcus sp. TaxID=2038636 RepID=UPI0020844073|nr:MAG: hypothetical protein DHS20C04_06810 [Marinicaulis sp.]
MTKREPGSFLRWLSKPEAIIGLSAVFVSVVAVGVSAYEATIIRASQRASVWPNIQLSRSMFYTDLENGAREWTLTFNAENVGVGPALIKDFRVTVDGAPYTTWGAAINAILGDDEEIAYGQSSINRTTVPVGRAVQMFQYRDAAKASQIYNAMDGLEFIACYCSVFDQCWTSSFNSEEVGLPVKSCKADGDSFAE